ncbi:hypothetical protein HK104_000485 [Borealophlyctis nickersoniae]|nr:hypothetical protein HK104_000485 [Borealophlyctis nickersoniae]
MDVYGNSALHYAASHNDHTLACLLLLKGADPNAKNRSGITPVIVAKRMGFGKVVKVLKKHGGIVPAAEEQLRGNFKDLQGRSRLLSEDAEMRKRSMSLPLTQRVANANAAGLSGGTTGKGPAAARVMRHTSQAVIPMVATSAVAPSSMKLSGSSSTVNSVETYVGEERITEGKPDHPSKESTGSFQKLLPCKRLPIYNVAYLGIGEELLAKLDKRILESSDENGSTTLMKAAYRGHVKIIRALLARGVDVDARDAGNHTALVWAALCGNLDAVKCLVSEGRANVNGAQGEARLAARLSPLMASVFNGHVDVAECLLNSGADVNLRVGPGNGRTALMVAAWTRREPLVLLLKQRGAVVDTDVEKWLKKGIILLKRVQAEMNAWSGSSESLASMSKLNVGSGSSATLNVPSKGIGMKEKLTYLTATESEAIATLEGMLVAKMDPHQDNMPEGSAADSLDNQPAVKQRRDVGKNRRAGGGFRQGMNLEKLIGQNPGLVMELTEHVPDSGTELDSLWLAVFRCVLQLVMAANKNMKRQCVFISAKAIHHAGEIVRAVESMRRLPASPLASANKPVGLAGLKGDSPFCFGGPIAGKLAELAKTINMDLSKQLLTTTKLAIGVWPPPQAQSEMIKSAANLARACRTLADLANTTGFFPLLEKPMELNVSLDLFLITTPSRAPELNNPHDQFVPYEDTEDAENEPEDRQEALNYEEYKRESDLRVIEAMTKTGQRPLSAHSMDFDDPDQRFFAQLDENVVQFVETMTEVKRAHDQHLKQEYINATSKVNERADILAENIRNSELLEDFPDDLLLTAEDAARLEAGGTRLSQTYPAVLRSLWLEAFHEVERASDQLMAKGRLASGVLPPQGAADEMLQATIPCARAVKKLVTLTKESVNKLRVIVSEERRKRELWKKACLENETTKRMFQIWESNLLNPLAETTKAADEKETVLPKLPEDSDEGLALENVGGVPVIKGGRLTKLFERVTSRLGPGKMLLCVRYSDENVL